MQPYLLLIMENSWGGWGMEGWDLLSAQALPVVQMIGLGCQTLTQPND